MFRRQGRCWCSHRDSPRKPPRPPRSIPVPAGDGAGPRKRRQEPKEPGYKSPGITIPRANGTFLGLEVVNGNFKLSFYDKKKKPMAVDVSGGLALAEQESATTGDIRTVLNGSGTA